MYKTVGIFLNTDQKQLASIILLVLLHFMQVKWVSLQLSTKKGIQQHPVVIAITKHHKKVTDPALLTPIVGVGPPQKLHLMSLFEFYRFTIIMGEGWVNLHVR